MVRIKTRKTKVDFLDSKATNLASRLEQLPSPSVGVGVVVCSVKPLHHLLASAKSQPLAHYKGITLAKVLIKTNLLQSRELTEASTKFKRHRCCTALINSSRKTWWRRMIRTDQS